MMKKEFEVRDALARDQSELAELWSEVFGDDKAEIDRFFEEMGGVCDCVLAEAEGKIVAAAYVLSGIQAEDYSCAYIYAVATAEDFRGNGAASEICLQARDMAFDDGADIVATMPATNSLCEFYENLLDMVPCFVRGAEGVEFCEDWETYANSLGEGGVLESENLRAVAKKGVDLEKVKTMGWKYCLN